ncbi:phospho-N-acetylmuramoyl-pentapeptide-transferase [Bacillus toyonensis]|uniref:phospho-N-acetylmuramoyl-pentapeptide- transferase n=1 Tax=Bacillus toyonensis TaxID=155322 RepID=UPI002E219E1F|nr:phospho-N-acetylmuramoyl-pentapeptide-transferase [Bacillus toyonensis]MED2737367.1 phospho-N-acetylmuramoyl-pentapeptide-transferase [Bacillus toyonensis]
MKFLLLFITSFIISILAAPYFIQLLKKFQFGQSIREEGPESHKKKSGTPTLGGLIFLFSLTISTLAFIDLKPEILLILFLTLGNGVIGFLDDFIKIHFKRNLGLTSKQKLVGQFLISMIFLFFLQKQGLDTTLYITGTELSLDLSWFYYAFVILLVIGTTNATNLTDGLDGLLAGTSMIALGTFGVVAYNLGNINISLFIAAFIGGLFGFLLFNKNPAKVFMGDTGSLAVGGALVGIAVILKAEILLALIGGVFVLETLSVILQVASFKTRKKRIFKMSPLHHHYELSGFSETQVVKGFWIAGLILSVISLAIVL